MRHRRTGDTYLYKIETVHRYQHGYKMDISTAERQLRRAQKRYDAAIHRVDCDKDVIMRDPQVYTPMEGVEETPVLLLTPPKTTLGYGLVNGFYCQIQIII